MISYTAGAQNNNNNNNKTTEKNRESNIHLRTIPLLLFAIPSIFFILSFLCTAKECRKNGIS